MKKSAQIFTVLVVGLIISLLSSWDFKKQNSGFYGFPVQYKETHSISCIPEDRACNRRYLVGDYNVAAFVTNTLLWQGSLVLVFAIYKMVKRYAHTRN